MATTQTLEDSYLARPETPTRQPGMTIYERVFRVPLDQLDALMPAIGDTARDDTSEIVVAASPEIVAGAIVAWIHVTYEKRIAGSAV